MTTAWICRTCGVQQAPGSPPALCPICDDERQYVPPGGQQWTTLEELAAAGRSHRLEPLEDGLTGIVITPRVGIGQRPILVQTEGGNVLWDCTAFLDAALVEAVANLGGVDAIAISHPHFYGAMVSWAHAFDAHVWIPEADRAWVQRPDPAIRYWSDEVQLAPGVRAIQCGGHFDGSAILHWDGADGRGVILVGDTASVVQDLQHFTFMRSYPNYIPLPPSTVRQIEERVTRYPFERAYGAWSGDVISAGAEASLHRSADRYIAWTQDPSRPGADGG